MGKYEPLGQFLRNQAKLYVPMSFAEIEEILGAKLPSSKKQRAWWSNNPSNNVMTRQWLDAGYETESVDLTGEKLVFRKKKLRGGLARDQSTKSAGKTGSVSKYEPLGVYLKQQVNDFIPMTFTEIEAIIGTKLPESKIYPAWWSNNPSNNTMTSQWLMAGYQTESVDIAGEKLVFKKSKVMADSLEDLKDEDLPDHPIFGCMAGTITVMPGVDLTEPMDFGWGGKLYNE